MAQDNDKIKIVEESTLDVSSSSIILINDDDDEVETDRGDGPPRSPRSPPRPSSVIVLDDDDDETGMNRNDRSSRSSPGPSSIILVDDDDKVNQVTTSKGRRPCSSSIVDDDNNGDGWFFTKTKEARQDHEELIEAQSRAQALISALKDLNKDIKCSKRKEKFKKCKKN